MRVTINPRHNLTDRELRDRVVHQLTEAMGPIGEALDNVEVYVTDVNGPRGGADKRCRILARLASGSSVVVSRTHRDALAAVRSAASLCRRSVRSRLKRRWSGRGRLPRRSNIVPGDDPTT
jgi:hypothetical protein